jgi:rubredoxin-NAD+ reductase
MDRQAPVVIVGTGLAGYGLAREFRKLDTQTPLLLISADDGRSYSKPMLSTAFAKGQDADALVMAEAGAMAEQLNAEIRTHSRVTAIDAQTRRLWLGNETIDYRDLVLALGAECVRVPVDGDATERILSINDLEDYARFRAALAGRQRVLILGAGLIGCEFANDLRLGGFEVDLVGLAEQPMPDLLPAQLGDALSDALRELGVNLYLGRTLASLNHSGDGLQALLSDGTRLECDLVLSAVGLRPRTALAATAGLARARHPGRPAAAHLRRAHLCPGRLRRGGRPQPALRDAPDGLRPRPGQDPGRRAR